MNNTNNIGDNTFGYSEMYEWDIVPINTSLFGKFVQFSNTYDRQHTIEFATDENDIIGVSSVNSACLSDNPNEWFLKYAFNEYGDTYLSKDDIAVGTKEYDNVNEISFIKTQKQTIYTPVVSSNFDETKQYIPRLDRNEWVKVNIIGKCIVEDDGTCQGGEYCKLYNGNDNTKFGIAIPATKEDTCRKWRVLNRVSDKTILIFYK